MTRDDMANRLHSIADEIDAICRNHKSHGHGGLIDDLDRPYQDLRSLARAIADANDFTIAGGIGL